MDEVIFDIIATIVSQCSKNGYPVDDSLAAFMVKTVVLDPTHRFQLDRELKSTDVDKLIDLCVDRLCQNDTPPLDTLRMQVVFDTSHASMEEKATLAAEDISAESSAEKRVITESSAKDKPEVLYGKIVSFALAVSQLGTKDDKTALRETTAALESIFPRSEISTFISLSRRDQTEHLEEMAHIVTGIRLFNRSAGKGGSTIEDVPRLLLVEATKEGSRARRESERVNEQIAQYTAVINHMQFDNSAKHFPVAIERLQEELNNRRQYSSYLQIVEEEIAKYKAAAVETKAAFDLTLSEVHGLVHSKTSVPTDQIYPRFVTASQQWKRLVEARRQIGGTRTILDNLLAFANAEEVDEGAAGPGYKMSLTPTMVMEARSALRKLSGTGGEQQATSTPDGDVVVLKVSEVPDGTSLMFKGYCPWTLVHHDGELALGDPTVGVARVRGIGYFACADGAALGAFASDARSYIDLAARMAKNSPDLVVQLGEDVLDLLPSSRVVEASGEKVLVDGGTQTVTHPRESYIDPDYEWNEWEMRRKALMLVNLRNKLTHSTQTNKSHFKRDNATQHYPQKDQGSQTKKDGSTSVPRPTNYVSGLRGNADCKMAVVNLTLDIEVQPK